MPARGGGPGRAETAADKAAAEVNWVAARACLANAGAESRFRALDRRLSGETFASLTADSGEQATNPAPAGVTTDSS